MSAPAAASPQAPRHTHFASPRAVPPFPAAAPQRYRNEFLGKPGFEPIDAAGGECGGDDDDDEDEDEAEYTSDRGAGQRSNFDMSGMGPRVGATGGGIAQALRGQRAAGGGGAGGQQQLPPPKWADNPGGAGPPRVPRRRSEQYPREDLSSWGAGGWAGPGSADEVLAGGKRSLLSEEVWGEHRQQTTGDVAGGRPMLSGPGGGYPAEMAGPGAQRGKKIPRTGEGAGNTMWPTLVRRRPPHMVSQH